MTAAEVLAAVADRGIELWRVGERLRFKPKCAVTPDLAALLKELKAELMGLIADAPSNGAARPIGSDPIPIVADGVLPTHEDWPAVGWPDCETIPADEVEPCAVCRRIDHWQDGLGNWKCRSCQPPKWSGQSVWNTAERLRGKNKSRRSA